LIYLDSSKKYQVHPDGLQVLNNLSNQSKIGIISVNGIMRTGKSYLLNQLVKMIDPNSKAEQSFKTSPGVISCT